MVNKEPKSRILRKLPTQWTSYNPTPYQDDLPAYEKDGKLYGHPVRVAHYGLSHYSLWKRDANLRSYESFNKALEWVEANAKVQGDIALWPYEFDFDLHGKAEDRLSAPWYSSMAQGQIASLLCRGFIEFNDEGAKDMAKMALNSFRLEHGKDDPWLTWTDSEGNLWFEEYPGNPPDLTLNGIMYAMLGLFDYYHVTADEEALKLYLHGADTLKANIDKFIDKEAKLSVYCLAHRTLSHKYHGIHIAQLRILYKQTGDKFFRDKAKEFESL